ncbi:hypothetical protein NPIL_121461 [Nephila pilipes]|uniref:Uncharacterized protein n=1 Tax=Nephila pilipes TaxID=299642 RepID=A0A8X6NYZ4_NEPPI|nr:hypothetical protein NPIL_121461 [Nephila pilipes]
MSAKTLYRHLKSSADIPIRNICSEHITVQHFYLRHPLEKYRLQSPKKCIFLQGIEKLDSRWKKHPRNIKYVVECFKLFLIVASEEMLRRSNETEAI